MIKSSIPYLFCTILSVLTMVVKPLQLMGYSFTTFLVILSGYLISLQAKI